MLTLELKRALFARLEKDSDFISLVGDGSTTLSFLNKVWPLRDMPSKDQRFKNAYDDAFQHLVNNNDWNIEETFLRQLELLQRLLNSISAKLGDNLALINKLNRLTVKTLGSSLEENLATRLDYETARESLCYYDANDIPRIGSANIPEGVTEVRFKTVLSSAIPTTLHTLPNKGRLFAAL